MSDEKQGCCRKTTPKERILALGYLQLSSTLVALVQRIHAESEDISNGNIRVIVSLCFACATDAIIIVLLIVGIKQNNPDFLFPWLIIQAIGLVSLLFAPFYPMYVHLEGPQLGYFLCIVIGGLVFGTYYWILVYKYKKGMIKEVQEQFPQVNLEPTEIV